MNSESDSDDLLKLTVEIISAHVSNNTLPASELQQDGKERPPKTRDQIGKFF